MPMCTDVRKIKGKVLVMDDEEIIIMALEALLQTLGYRVENCSDGQAVLALIANSRTKAGYCAIFLDLTIRGGLGAREIIAEVRKYYPRTPVFAMSGNAHDPVMVAPARYGFTGSICKPFRICDFEQVLN